MRFEFSTATRIVCGPGVSQEAGRAVREWGRHALVVVGKSPDRAALLFTALDAANVARTLFSVAEEPSIAAVQTGVAHARSAGCDVVIACGGGSVIDAGKALAAFVTNTGEPVDYLEVIGRGRPLEQAPLPIIAIPTTAGTGAEVTRNAVLASPEHRVKVSLRSPLLLPRLAMVDPELSLGLPAEWTASTGLDALTQLIEPFVSCRANPLTDGLCREGIARVARSLRRACEAPGDRAAREDMALASLFSGLALANAGLGAVHGFAAPIGGRFPAPHGAVCAALLAPVMELNVRALRERRPQDESLRRYDEVGRLLTGRPGAGVREGIEWVAALVGDLGIRPLRSFGLGQEDVAPLCDHAAKASSMRGNPVELTHTELSEILGRAL